MTRLTTSTLALIVAASAAFADNHGDEQMTQSGLSDNKASDSAGLSGDKSDKNLSEKAGKESDSAENGQGTDLADMKGDLIRSRDITGGNVYTFDEAADEGWDPTTVHEGVGDDWNTIGEIEDVVLSEDGKITGIVAEIGGFLDIADKHVVISIDDLNLVAVDDANYGYVTRQNEEELEEMEDIDEGFWN